MADAILGFSIKDLCLNDPDRLLNKTHYTQPALYVVNALSFFDRIDSGNDKPDYVAGHSLGEYNALLAAECFDFETGLHLVKKRGELMSMAKEGGMAAILNISREEIVKTLQDNHLNHIDIANFNTFSQIVISGEIDEIRKAESVFENFEARYIPLNTSGAFHSRFMEYSANEFSKYLREFSFGPPKIPVIANTTAQLYGRDDIVEKLSAQMSSSVKWSESIIGLLCIAAENQTDMEFVEVGNGVV